MHPWKDDHKGDIQTLWGCLVDQTHGIPCWHFGCRLHRKKIFGVICNCIYSRKFGYSHGCYNLDFKLLPVSECCMLSSG